MAEPAAYRPREIDGFSLYWHWTKKHWQMNVRRKGEPGWDITHIPDEQAQAILRMLENSGHPDGPWKVVDNATQALGLTIAKHIELPDNITSEEIARKFLHLKNGDLTCRHGRPLHQDCHACDEDDGMEGISVGNPGFETGMENLADAFRWLTEIINGMA